MDAWAGFQAAPDVAFNISAFTDVLAAMRPAQASSYEGPTDVAVVMASLAKQMGYTFILASPYFWGTARQQTISGRGSGCFPRPRQ